jgi:hypothetical protein
MTVQWKNYPYMLPRATGDARVINTHYLYFVCVIAHSGDVSKISPLTHIMYN